MGKVWKFRATNLERAKAIYADHGVAPAAAKFLAGRRTLSDTPERLEQILAEKPKVPNIGTPPGAREVAALLETWAANPESGPLGIVTDYDCDGACAAAIIARTMRSIVYDIKRQSLIHDAAVDAAYNSVIVESPAKGEGYGVNERLLNSLRDRKCQVILTLDCGTDEAALINPWLEQHPEMGIATLDHHETAAKNLPKQALVCNPWAHGKRTWSPDHQAMCTGALALAVARRVLHSMEYLEPSENPHDPEQAQEWRRLHEENMVFAALASMADVQDVTDPLIRSLLKTAEQIPAPRIIREILGKPYMTAKDAAWSVAPAVNTAKRFGLGALAAIALSETDEDKICEFAEELKSLNEKRKELSARLRDYIATSFHQETLEKGPANVVVIDKDASGVGESGMMGLGASTLIQNYGWPGICLMPQVDAETGEETLVGSGRSTMGFDLGAFVRAQREAGVLLTGGGHAAACGLSLNTEMFPQFKENFKAEFRLARPESSPAQYIDAELSSWDLNRLDALADSLERLLPFGKGMYAPSFAVCSAAVDAVRRTDAGHTFFMLTRQDKHGSGTIQGVYWSMPDLAFERMVRAMNDGQSLDFAGEIDRSEYKGKSETKMIVRSFRSTP